MERRNNISLKPYNTFGITAQAKALFECATAADVHEAYEASRDEKILVLGGGSNVLFTSDFDGHIIRPTIGGVQIIKRDGGDFHVRVGAGVEWDYFVSWAVSVGLHGVENLSGIPGNVGASPVQNIGAYGVEAKDVIYRVEGLNMATGRSFSLSGDECQFGYRESIFKKEWRGRAIITHVTFNLKDQPNFQLDYGALRTAVEELGAPSAANIRSAVLKIRNCKLPDPKVMGNAGSFFKNPEVESSLANGLLTKFPNMPHFANAQTGLVKIPAGWLIEQSGWKGRSLGPAAVHDKQALVLVNKGGATGQDIIKLCQAVQTSVKEQFGITLTPEVNFVGD